MIHLTVSESTLEAILNCLDADAEDPTEPERYRQWYAEAAAEVRATAQSTTDAT